MSPPLAALFLLLTTAAADVQHVLQGTAQTPNALPPSAINCLSHTPNPSTSFWWADPDSPFKHAYEYFKKCSLKGNCVVPPSPDEQPVNIGGSQPQGMDLSNNPFFAAQFGKKTATAVNGERINAEGGFLGVQPAQPFSKKPFPTKRPEESLNQGAQPFPIGGTEGKKPFATSYPSDLGGSVNANPYFKTDRQPGLSCKDAGYICVSRDVCKDGVVDEKVAEGLYEVGKKEQYCDVTTQTCCQLPSLRNSIASGDTIKFSGTPGFSPGTIQVLPEATEPKPVIHLGDHQATGKPTRDAPFQGPAYLPPVASSPTTQYIPPTTSTTQRPYSPFPSSVSVSTQYVPSRVTPQYIPPSSVSTQYVPSSVTPEYLPPSTPRPFSPSPSVSTQYVPSRGTPQYLPPSTPRPYNPSPSSVSVSTQYIPSRVTPQYLPPSTPRPYNPPPSSVSVSTQYIPSRVTPEYLPPSTPKPYSPPQPSVTPQYLPPSTPRPTTQKPYSPFPSSTTSKPYVPPSTTPAPTRPPNPSSGYVYNRPTPAFEYPTPGVDTSNINNQYLFPKKETPSPATESSIVRISVIPTRPDAEGSPAQNRDTVLATRRPPVVYEQSAAPPAGCAAALKCVQEVYCTAEGVVSSEPVALTREQEIARVPTTVCTIPETGALGKCCRDPYYKDPWPSANLVNGVDDGQYKEDPNLGQYSPSRPRNIRSGPRVQNSASVPAAQVAAVSEDKPICGQRHLDTQPKGPSKLDVNFAEIPWQAMVLRDANRSLLCGGAIIQRDVVLTTAHCVDGLETRDVLIKGGEWKLGIDEEPLPFQIVRVATIVRHPGYKPGSLVNDLALLFLDDKLRLAKNIGTICLPKPNQIPTSNCIATGWGKRILQLHAKGAIMHSIGVNVMPSEQCKEVLAEKYKDSLPNYSPNTLCGFSNIDQCRVDYGSALACVEDGHYTLSGIYAWDTGCRDQSQIGGYVAPDVEWIESCVAKPEKELKQLEADFRRQYEN